ncbi:acetyltransferase [Aggregicoccus sp. 17bor-14]|uniref:serine O-acetyltransferase n=1 Tax=Myxococcaceae TaxID=31 RepID=UPI00129C5496|nr:MULTISPECIES: acetyltransferase [Myxococcaceae]MBF5040772.1 acetyltransferase [Simulacricoccus sp. 17bor-14]MRI86560.1 acetyltransferase [Aggregicoccus sp. 17bor-14]
MGPNALSFYRTARRLRAAGVPLLPQVLSTLGERLHQTRLDLRAQLGEGVELGYGGIGVVVAPGVHVGPRTFLCQNVTLGERPDAPGVPRLGADVMVGAGAMVLGPVTVGDHAEIGANAVVTEDVPPGAVVAGVPARILRRKPLPPAPATV